MADLFVDPIVDKIFKACSVYFQDQYRWQTGMKEELERLQENYPMIQAVVSAYNRAQIRDPALNKWIWQLRDAIDEADDVLDDFEYEKLEEQHTGNKKQQKVAKLVKKIGKRALMMDPNLKRLEKVVKKLDKVSAQVSTFLLLLEKAKQVHQEQKLLLDNRETGPLPKNDLIGRGEEKDFVMQWLRKPTNEDPTHMASPTLYKNISLLSIVGHGGMGKTTLLQHIYEDLKEDFELKIWVCVSNEFDAKKVIVDMLECLNKERPRLESLAAVQESLKYVMQSKKFLLVLDDIWEEDMSKWENVLSPLSSGSFGSKILITTRMDAVASTIAKIIKKKPETLIIKGLEEDVCLKLLNTHAFAGVENLGAHTKLTYIASLIVKKLSGSPLATKIIGGLLNSNLNESFWMNILDSTHVLNIEPEPGRNNILPILSLSFTFLPQPLQNCFAFCGIFPQDHEFDKDDFVRMWIALGFIKESSIEGETLEDIGGRYFDALVRKSFFDEFQHNNRIYYKMHDLLHDLAQSISSEECFRFAGDDVLSFKIPKNVRHLFVKTENLEVLRMIKDVKNLHSLFIESEIYHRCYPEILAAIFEASRRIRLLFIYSSGLEKISETIKNLRHLRYLNLGANLTRMPISLSSLYHLRFLIYRQLYNQFFFNNCLPGDVSNLSNLRHLESLPNVFSSTPGIGKLRSLQVLNEFIVKNENGYRIGELEHMSELRKLEIHILENVMDAREACTAKLFEKRKLSDLSLNWGTSGVRNIVNSDLDVNVLENLEPYKNLKRLSIVSYEGASSAKWMYNAHLISNLEYIRLDTCSEWETLPPFGQLPHLKWLHLRNMPKAKRLDYKFHGNDKVSVFPSLEVLYMEGLQVLEDWFDGAGAAADDCFFPCLTALFLDNCPNLQELPYLPPKLKHMQICRIGWKALNFKQGTSNCCPNLISLGGQQQVESGIEKFQLSLSEVVIDNPSLLPKLPMSKGKEVGSSAMWDRNATITFCDLCVREVQLGNRPSTHFSKEGWQNVMTKFNELTGRDYDRTKLKNKWDQLKKDWKTWKELKMGSTGLGWDPHKRTIDAPEHWWTAKIEALPGAKKFKTCGIDPDLEEKLDEMFTGIVATGTHAFTPSGQGFSGVPEEFETVQLCDSVDGPTEVQTDVQSASTAKRPRVKNKKKDVAFIKETVESILESCKARTGSAIDSSIDECLQFLDACPEVAGDIQNYVNYVKWLRYPTIRHFFLKLDPKYRLPYLRTFMDH